MFGDVLSMRKLSIKMFRLGGGPKLQPSFRTTSYYTDIDIENTTYYLGTAYCLKSRVYG